MKFSPRDKRLLDVLKADLRHALSVAVDLSDGAGVDDKAAKELRAITRTDGSLPCGLLFELIEQDQQASDDDEGVPLADLAAGK